MRRPDASLVVAGCEIAAALITDYAIIRKGGRPHTKMLKDNWPFAVAAVGYLGLHVAEVLPWWLDVFAIAGRVTGLHPGQAYDEAVTKVTEDALDSMLGMA